MSRVVAKRQLEMAGAIGIALSGNPEAIAPIMISSGISIEKVKAFVNDAAIRAANQEIDRKLGV